MDWYRTRLCAACLRRESDSKENIAALLRCCSFVLKKSQIKNSNSNVCLFFSTSILSLPASLCSPWSSASSKSAQTLNLFWILHRCNCLWFIFGGTIETLKFTFSILFIFSRGLFASNYTETHYLEDGSVVSGSHNSTVLFFNFSLFVSLLLGVFYTLWTKYLKCTTVALWPLCLTTISLSYVAEWH